MEKLFSLLESIIWLGVAEYVKQKYGSYLHSPLNRATCNMIWKSSLFALLTSLILIVRNIVQCNFFKLRPQKVDDNETHIADKSGLAFGSSAAALTIFVIQNHNMGNADDETVDMGEYYAFVASHTGYALSLTTFLFTLAKLKHFRKNDTYNVVKIMPITYILSISYSMYNMNQTYELNSQRIFSISAFSMIQVSLWLLYKGLLGFDKSDIKRKINPAKKQIDRSMLQYVFTVGEWVVISTFISIVLTDYILRYVISSDEISAKNLSPDLIVSQAGITGCLIGVYISRAQNIIQLYKTLGRLVHVGNNNFFVKSLLPTSIVVVTTTLFVSISLTKYCTKTKLDDSFCPRASVLNSNLDFLALPFRWLIGYMFQNEHHLYYGRHRSLRLSLLLYWAIMMVLCITGAIIIGKKVDIFLGIKRKRMIIVARKYFHLVAVVLFLQPTLLAPSMMGLSYAVATALLILVENLRNEHESPETTRKYSDVVANGSIRPKKSFITDFYELFFDEKDHKAKEGGFVITHISLLCGCAMPLWIHLLYPRYSLTPFLGIICVGVGDAAGAIVGTFYGKHKWPDSRRTIEGSIAMLISMSIVTIWLLRSYNLDTKYDVLIFILMLVTIIEAATYQLDNICLPLLSVILLYAVDCT